MIEDGVDPREELRERTAPPHETPALLDVRSLADLLACSPRHIRRLVESGKMPSPVKLGSLVRWSRAVIEDWVAHGCPCTTAGDASADGGRRGGRQ